MESIRTYGTMKKLMTLMLVIGFADVSFGQKLKEWLRQKKTQKQYLIEQIAQLKIYLELTEKGYKIAKHGLTLIGDIKNGEFKLHKNYFDSLKVVNPKIAVSPKITWIGVFYGEVKSVCNSCMSTLTQSKFLNSDEQAYLRAVFDRLTNNCDKIVVSLKEVTSDGSYAMTDDERVKRIEDLYQQILYNYTFCKAFCNESTLLAAGRVKEKDDVTTGRALRGIK